MSESLVFFNPTAPELNIDTDQFLADDYKHTNNNNSYFSSGPSSPNDSSSVSSIHDYKSTDMTQAANTAVPSGVKLEPQLDASMLGGASTKGMDESTIRELLKEQDIKRQRLARKAELARMSRKRKKMRLTDLEQKVQQLEEQLTRERKLRKMAEDNFALAQRRITGEEGDPLAISEQVLRQESKNLHQELRKTIGKPEAEGDVHTIVSNIVNIFSKRNKRTTEQIKSLNAYLAPSMPLRFLEWAMSQSDKFYEDETGLWHSLFSREIGLSEEQMKALHKLRASMQVQRATMSKVNEAYEGLASAVRDHASQANANMQQLTSTFTPDQLAKFFSWVDTYGEVCVKINV